VKVGVAVIDLATGLSSVGAITAALYQREKSGKGTKIECSLLETQVYHSKKRKQDIYNEKNTLAFTSFTYCC